MWPCQPWAVADAAPVLGAIAQALSYIHEQGVLHLDLKPENVLCTRNGTVKITDFGLASPHLDARTLSELGLAAGVESHSIIADRRDPPGAGGGDGLVSYESAHLDGVSSESLVSSGHLCQARPAVIREVRRILAEHGRR